MIKTLTTAAIIALSTVTTSFAGTVTQQQIETDFSDSSTEAQRDFAWADYEDESTSITGTIYDVDVPGWLVKEYKVTMKIANDVTVYCRIPEAQKSRVKGLRAGQVFTCEGTLFTYAFVFGSAGVSIKSDGSNAVDTPVLTKVESAIALLESNGYTVTK